MCGFSGEENVTVTLLLLMFQGPSIQKLAQTPQDMAECL